MMKIPNSLRTIYESQRDKYKNLKIQVDKLVGNLKESGWHYFSRIKDAESYALKIETGRVEKSYEIEDYFGCTIVVENLDAISRAEKLICDTFILHERRPSSAELTSKLPDSFRFDDLRLYVKWMDTSGTPPTGLNDVLFEVQIKTFLQHAWIIATHDLIYKSNEKSWPKERIAYQVKAMLEHAEISIHEAENLSKSVNLPRKENHYESVSDVINLLNELWDNNQLPKDKKRLAETINKLISQMNIDVSELKQILHEENIRGNGTKILNLSPYGVIIQSLLNQRSDKILKHLSDDHGHKKIKIYLPREINIPEDIDKKSFKNVIMEKKDV